MSFNQVTLVGRLNRDPEIRTLNSGKRIASFRLITEERRGGKKFTEGHNVVAYNEGLAKLMEQYCGKGDMILVTGALRNTSWEANGEKKYSYEIAMGPNDTLKFLSTKKKTDEVDDNAAEPGSEG